MGVVSSIGAATSCRCQDFRGKFAPGESGSGSAHSAGSADSASADSPNFVCDSDDYFYGAKYDVD